MNDRHSPGLCKRRLARLLVRFRERAGLTLADAATRLYLTKSSLSRMERAETRVNVHLLKSMLDVYEIGADRWDPLIDMALQSSQKGWWHEFGVTSVGAFVDFETEAEEIIEFGLGLMPGLLQSDSYARAWFRRFHQGRRDRDHRADRGTALRLARQERLTTEEPLRLTAVLDESVLVRPVGGPEALRHQLEHLDE